MTTTEDSIRRVVETGLQAALSRDAINGANWLFKPEFEHLAEPRIESRFDDNLPVLKHLTAALELAAQYDTAEVARGLADLLPHVRWSQKPRYTRETMDSALIDGYGYAGLVGPDCPLQCEVPRMGYLLMGPDVTYHNHQHGPREFYLVLTPGAQWKLDDGEWFDVAAGDLILHDAWQMHAMRSRDLPLLTLAGWVEQGDRTAMVIGEHG